ncbi:MAG: T9SS type A sorting domain-containing protein, partial [Saprospiraceae bacterium]|nr:T9SS type A sorting domain-containing protein [Saprospiraceae bacterium]
LPSPQNVGGDDAIDSDADPVMGMTEIFTIESNETDLTWDAGFYSKCDNLDNPGTISGYQFLCGPGNDPDPIVSVTDPSGGSGEIEYLWMYSTVPGPFDPAIWVPIPNSNTASFDPGPLFETTYFARCARRECCTTYLESNIIVIEVGDVAVANINGPSLVCSGEENNFFAAGNGPGAVVEWNFGPNATPQTATGSPVGVTFNSFGTYTIELQVTEDGCTSTDYKEITVSNSPAVCMSGLVIDVEVLNSNSDIRVEWQLEDQDETMIYTVEHSIDGINFEAVGLVVNETEQIDHINYYQFIHEDPKQGRNYYRVKVTDNDGLQAHSQIAEAIIYGDSRLMMIYPNPVQDQMVIELFETYEDDVNIRLISMDGRVLQQLSVDSATKRIPLGMTNYPSGTYLVQVRYGKLDVKTFKVVKQ